MADVFASPLRAQDVPATPDSFRPAPAPAFDCLGLDDPDGDPFGTLGIEEDDVVDDFFCDLL